MKKFLLLLMISACVAACSKEENGINDNSNEQKEYIVSIGMAGEILDINESPLTKSSGDDLYGVQVYRGTENLQNTPYAYGLFDDKTKMNIKLIGGDRYKNFSNNGNKWEK